MEGVLRTRTLAETRGFRSAPVETGSDRVLGFTAFGVEAGEVVAVVQFAMAARMPYTGLRDAVQTHRTIAEGLGAFFSAFNHTRRGQIQPADQQSTATA